MMALRWLHLVFGIIWIGLLYFFNLVLTPAMKKCDPQLRIKIYPELMPGAMGWFRSSALVTVIVGLRYFTITVTSDEELTAVGRLNGCTLGRSTLRIGRPPGSRLQTDASCRSATAR